MTTPALYSPDALHNAFSQIAALGAVVGDFSGVRALRLARIVYERHPALFPWFAAEIVEAGARSACWSLAQIASDIVGAYDVFTEARKIAADV